MMMLEAILWSVAAGAALGVPLRAHTLTCEGMAGTVHTNEPSPRLSWLIESETRGTAQTAYQVHAATSVALLESGKPDLWDSGKVASRQSYLIPYGGRRLRSGEPSFWRVRVWDNYGGSSPFSATAEWRSGLHSTNDWGAKWITAATSADFSKSAPAPYLRKAFDLPKKSIARATLRASARGLYVPFLNGRRVGADSFTPGWTDYNRRIQYQTYDVTDRVMSGPNAIGMVLGDGWYCGHVCWFGRNQYGSFPEGLARLTVEYDDGKQDVIVSDGSWKGSAGPILASDMLMGEAYDARREHGSWSESTFDDSKWLPVLAAGSLGHVPIVPQPCEPVRAWKELAPVSFKKDKNGAWVFDLGQNLVGWARLKLSAPAGAEIHLRFAEVLNADGTIYVTNLRSAKQTDTYVAKGAGEETWEPLFTFHGFRYVEVAGLAGEPTSETITGIAAGSDLEQTGLLETSNPLLNQLQHNIWWGMRGNYLEVPTDCPQRDERLGWMGDAQIFAATATFNANVLPFLTKWVTDVADAQTPDGAFPNVAPQSIGLGDGAPAWADAGTIVPWTLYLRYGDARILDRHFGNMAKYVRMIEAANPDLLWRNRSSHNFGDWLSIEADTPRPVLATSYFAHSAWIVSRSAEITGRTDDARAFKKLFEEIRKAFNKAYVKPDGRIEGDTQTLYVLALRFDLLSAENRKRAARFLVEDIQKRKGHLSTGFVGCGHILPALTEAGENDLAYELLLKETFPSWLYSVKRGATTIWERWDGWTEEKGFQDPGMNSFNHYAFGSVGDWMYRVIGGIEPGPPPSPSGSSSGGGQGGRGPGAPGYQSFLLRPRPGGGLTWARASLLSPYGRIVSSWRIEGDVFEYTVEVPPNSTAVAWIPAASEDVTESGKPARSVDGVRYSSFGKGHATYELGSGKYVFRSKLR